MKTTYLAHILTGDDLRMCCRSLGLWGLLCERVLKAINLPSQLIIQVEVLGHSAAAGGLGSRFLLGLWRLVWGFCWIVSGLAKSTEHPTA